MAYTDEQYEQMAIKAIIEHKNKDYTDDEVKELYPLAIGLIIDNLKQSSTINRNIKSETQGPRSRTYKEDIVIIDSAIELLLGKPYARMY